MEPIITESLFTDSLQIMHIKADPRYYVRMILPDNKRQSLVYCLHKKAYFISQ